MAAPSLNLIVIRAADIEAAHRFYSALGLSFAKHAHGKAPLHYSSDEGSVVFEIYPQTGTDETTKGVRLGFKVSNLAEVVSCAQKHGAKIISPAKESPWGLRAVVEDPFGHRIEFLAASP
jgi:predicted enzyme related to lactoylglutathione lyase